MELLVHVVLKGFPGLEVLQEISDHPVHQGCRDYLAPSDNQDPLVLLGSRGHLARLGNMDRLVKEVKLVTLDCLVGVVIQGLQDFPGVQADHGELERLDTVT